MVAIFHSNLGIACIVDTVAEILNLYWIQLQYKFLVCDGTTNLTIPPHAKEFNNYIIN